MTLFDRCRRAPVLRVLALVAALLASQASLACAMEAVFAGDEAQVSIAQPVDDSSQDCVDLCADCVNCGTCCSLSASLRAHDAPNFGAPRLTAAIGFATTAPGLWAPATLLRPPIHAA
jgi:hypothetical protein